MGREERGIGPSEAGYPASVVYCMLPMLYSVYCQCCIMYVANVV